MSFDPTVSGNQMLHIHKDLSTYLNTSLSTSTYFFVILLQFIMLYLLKILCIVTASCHHSLTNSLITLIQGLIPKSSKIALISLGWILTEVFALFNYYSKNQQERSNYNIEIVTNSQGILNSLYIYQKTLVVMSYTDLSCFIKHFIRVKMSRTRTLK